MIPEAVSSTPKINHNHLTALLSKDRQEEFLGSEHQEHDPRQHPDRDRRGVVELQHDDLRSSPKNTPKSNSTHP